MKCTSILGHNWYYPQPNHRICKNCGETQRKCHSYDDQKEEYWEFILFDVWLKELDKIIQLEDIKRKGRLRSKAKAIIWLKTKRSSEYAVDAF